MLRNYFITAFRNILKQKFYAFINVLGLSIGITAAIFILIYILNETSYDRFHTTADRLYRVNLAATISGQEAVVAFTCPPLAGTLKEEVPEVEYAARIWEWNNTVVKHEELSFTEDKLYHTDPDFLKMFSFPLLAGDASTALNEPNSVLLSREMAEKYFGSINALGKIITIGNDNQVFKVTGVLENAPENSHLKYNFVTSLSSFEYIANSGVWLNNSLHTYFTTYPGADTEAVQQKMNEFIPKYIGPEIEKYLGANLETFMSSQNGRYGFNFFKVSDIHLRSIYNGEFEPVSDIRYVYIFSITGIFILLIATINFMNLATARSAGRAKEVGMRKTFGAFRGQLISQFMMESLIYTLIAVIFALILANLLLPEFNRVSGKSIDYLVFTEPAVIMGILAIVFLVTILSGSYPAFYLTGFQIASVTKGKASAGVRSGKIRGMLVVLQFSISIFLLICTAIVYQQLQYTQNKNLGFNKENLIVIYNAARLGDNRGPLKEALLSQNNVITASYANHIIPGTNNNTVFRTTHSDQDHIISEYYADYEHLVAMGFELSQGRFFSREFISDSTAVVVNEATVKEMGWSEPLNQEVLTIFGDKQEKLVVIGVLKDFNYESLRDNVRPLLIRLKETSTNLVVRFRGEDPAAAIALVEQEWKKYSNNEPFEFEFVDQKFDSLYRAEQRMGYLFTGFTILAILIACLGLLALSAFTAEQKTKEIGIRKSLGATEMNIITLLNREFSQFVIIAFFLAILPAYFFSRQWLESFVYRIDLNLLVFVVSGMITFLVALMTVSFQAVKASRLNPTESLRYE